MEIFKSVVAVLVVLICCSFRTAFCIDCFKCISMNNSYKPCDDPFHHNHSADILEAPCMGGRKNRDGVYPATSCIKIAGTFDNGETIMIRGCALDSGSITTDTEIVRMSHCGGFYYEKRYVKGCVQSCNDAEACNTAGRTSATFTAASLLLIFSVFTEH